MSRSGTDHSDLWVDHAETKQVDGFRCGPIGGGADREIDRCVKARRLLEWADVAEQLLIRTTGSCVNRSSTSLSRGMLAMTDGPRQSGGSPSPNFPRAQSLGVRSCCFPCNRAQGRLNRVAL